MTQPHPTTTGRRVRGATIVEVVTLVLAAGAVVGMTVPKLVGDPAAAADAAASQLASDLCCARERAVSTGRPCYVSFDRLAGTYAVHAGQTAYGPPVPTERPYVVRIGVGQTAGATIADLRLGTTGNTALSFDRSGAVATGRPGGPMLPLSAPGRVTVAAGFHRWTITVDPDTGEVGFEQ